MAPLALVWSCARGDIPSRAAAVDHGRTGRRDGLGDGGSGTHAPARDAIALSGARRPASAHGEFRTQGRDHRRSQDLPRVPRHRLADRGARGGNRRPQRRLEHTAVGTRAGGAARPSPSSRASAPTTARAPMRAPKSSAAATRWRCRGAPATSSAICALLLRAHVHRPVRIGRPLLRRHGRAAVRDHLPAADRRARLDRRAERGLRRRLQASC